LVRNRQTGDLLDVPVSVFNATPEQARKKAKEQGRKFYGNAFCGVLAEL
jgi:hypothetical protein